MAGGTPSGKAEVICDWTILRSLTTYLKYDGKRILPLKFITSDSLVIFSVSMPFGIRIAAFHVPTGIDCVCWSIFALYLTSIPISAPYIANGLLTEIISLFSTSTELLTTPQTSASL